MRITGVDPSNALNLPKSPFRIDVVEMRTGASVFVRANTDAGIIDGMWYEKDMVDE